MVDGEITEGDIAATTFDRWNHPFRIDPERALQKIPDSPRQAARIREAARTLVTTGSFLLVMERKAKQQSSQLEAIDDCVSDVAAAADFASSD